MPDIHLTRHTDSVAVACEHVESELNAAGWTERDVSRVSLAVGEAVSNAVEHGPTSAAPIHLRLMIEGTSATVRIDDGGVGPTGDRLRNAALPPDPLALGGRGLYILTQLADWIECDASGTLHIGFRQNS